MLNLTIKLSAIKRIGLACLLTMGVSSSVLAVHAQCANIEQSLADIEKQAEIYYTTSDYAFSDKKLLKKFDDAKSVFNDDKYNNLILSVKGSLGKSDKLISNLADVASYMHVWTGEQCF